MKSELRGLAMITVNSIMWPISAALEIPNLGLHVFWDGSVHQYVYPNLFVVTSHAYQTLSPSRLFLPRPARIGRGGRPMSGWTSRTTKPSTS